MTCHQHRCCRRRPASTTSDADTSLDYVLLAASETDVIDGAATMLRRFGATLERHEIGIRLNCRGERWRTELWQLSNALADPARRGLRVAVIPIAADPAAFQKALILAQPLDVFVRATRKPAAAPMIAKTGHERLSNVFKGESLE